MASALNDEAGGGRCRWGGRRLVGRLLGGRLANFSSAHRPAWRREMRLETAVAVPRMTAVRAMPRTRASHGRSFLVSWGWFDDPPGAGGLEGVLIVVGVATRGCGRRPRAGRRPFGGRTAARTVVLAHDAAPPPSPASGSWPLRAKVLVVEQSGRRALEHEEVVGAIAVQCRRCPGRPACLSAWTWTKRRPRIRMIPRSTRSTSYCRAWPVGG